MVDRSWVNNVTTKIWHQQKWHWRTDTDTQRNRFFFFISRHFELFDKWLLMICLFSFGNCKYLSHRRRHRKFAPDIVYKHKFFKIHKCIGRFRFSNASNYSNDINKFHFWFFFFFFTWTRQSLLSTAFRHNKNVLGHFFCKNFFKIWLTHLVAHRWQLNGWASSSLWDNFFFYPLYCCCCCFIFFNL